MTEKELYRYLKAKAKEERLREEVKALESVVYAPPCPPLSPVPPSHGCGEERYVVNAEKLDKLRRALNNAALSTNVYYLALERAEDTLTTTEQCALFDLLYRKGEDIKRAASKIGYSLGHTYRIRQAILTLVAPVSA